MPSDEATTPSETVPKTTSGIWGDPELPGAQTKEKQKGNYAGIPNLQAESTTVLSASQSIRCILMPLPLMML